MPASLEKLVPRFRWQNFERCSAERARVAHRYAVLLFLIAESFEGERGGSGGGGGWFRVARGRGRGGGAHAGGGDDGGALHGEHPQLRTTPGRRRRRCGHGCRRSTAAFPRARLQVGICIRGHQQQAMTRHCKACVLHAADVAAVPPSVVHLAISDVERRPCRMLSLIGLWLDAHEMVSSSPCVGGFCLGQ